MAKNPKLSSLHIWNERKSNSKIVNVHTSAKTEGYEFLPEEFKS